MKAIIDNLPILLGVDKRLDAAIEFTLKDPNNPQCLAKLSPHMKIRMKFNHPVWVKLGRREHRDRDEHVFSVLIWTHNSLCYAPKYNARYGYPLNLNEVESWEPIPKQSNEFQSFEEFKKKFDLKFITENEIQRLWASKSSQHGERYRRSDFRSLSRTGQELMKRFLRNFKGVTVEGIGYYKSSYGDYKVLEERYKSTGRPSGVFGRDITIGHQTNCEYVFYSSEYPNCGNGRYGLIANEKEYLWLEDD